jgi:hypothetical protein
MEWPRDEYASGGKNGDGKSDVTHGSFLRVVCLGPPPTQAA